jgi:long-subunit fatty acid transport protein
LTQGNGFNFKLGAIYKVNESVRLGAAIHSPTYFNFDEEYSFDAASEFSEGTSYEEETVFNTWSYKVRTPMRYMASLAYVFKDMGMFNVEYEFVDYSTAKFNDRRRFQTDYSEANQDIRNTLKRTHNLRFGAEYRLEPFVIRGGFRYEDNPFQTNLEFSPDESRKTYSLGSGYRSQNYNIDLTYMYSEWQNTTPLYESVPNAAIVDNKHHQIMLTVGWRW